MGSCGEGNHWEQVSTSQRSERMAYCLPGLDLDCGKLRRRELLGAGVSQPEDPWEVRERLSVYQPEHPWEVRERLLHSLFKGCRPCRRPRILRSGFSSTGWHCEGFSNRGFSRPFKGCSSGIVVSFRCRGRCPCGAFHCLLSGLFASIFHH